MKCAINRIWNETVEDVKYSQYFKEHVNSNSTYVQQKIVTIGDLKYAFELNVKPWNRFQRLQRRTTKWKYERTDLLGRQIGQKNQR